MGWLGKIVGGFFGGAVGATVGDMLQKSGELKDKRPAKNNKYIFTDEDLQNLLNRTYREWSTGFLSPFSEYFVNYTKGKSESSFARSWMLSRNIIRLTFNDAPPEFDEYLLFANASFVLTNKYFYFFTGENSGINEPESGKIALSDIVYCHEPESGCIGYRITLMLKSGQTIFINGLFGNLLHDATNYIRYYVNLYNNPKQALGM